jgi:hypothetical protein
MLLSFWDNKRHFIGLRWLGRASTSGNLRPAEFGRRRFCSERSIAAVFGVILSISTRPQPSGRNGIRASAEK